MVQNLDLQKTLFVVVTGVIMFCSFAFFGALPLVGYVVFPSAFPNMSEDQLFFSACIVTGIVLFFLGSVKSTFW